MCNRPTRLPAVLVGFAPPVSLRRACLADALASLTQLSNVGKRQPAKEGPHPGVKQRLATLRPTRKRVNSMWVRLATAGAAGAGLALVWQLVDRRSLVRASWRSFRLRLLRQCGHCTEGRADLPPIIRKKLREVRS